MQPPTKITRSAFTIREAREDDWPQIWPIIHDVITERQTFAYDPAMSEDDAKRGWLLTEPARVTVAVGDDRGLCTVLSRASELAADGILVSAAPEEPGVPVPRRA